MVLTWGVFPKLGVPFLGGPDNKDSSVWEFILGSPLFWGNYPIALTNIRAGRSSTCSGPDGFLRRYLKNQAYIKLRKYSRRVRQRGGLAICGKTLRRRASSQQKMEERAAGSSWDECSFPSFLKTQDPEPEPLKPESLNLQPNKSRGRSRSRPKAVVLRAFWK